MDNNNFHSSVFPLQQDDDANNDPQQLLFPQPYSNFIYQQDLVNDFAPFDSLDLGDNNITFNYNNNNNNNQRRNKQRKSSANSSHQLEKPSDDNKVKKVMHREIERQRRQEMSTLYASLRQQLPLENIKGKRSTSDHILEAANYIEQLQKNVKNLEERKEKLKKKSIIGLSNIINYPKSTGSSSSTPAAIVTVKECLDGMEILVNCVLNNEGFRLSRVLQLLLQQGLNIVNCSCAKTNTTSVLHTIRTEVSTDQPRINVDVIQQKLTDIIHSDTSFK